MRVKMFTDSDLDGAGCAIVAIAAFGQENIDVTYCSYHDINQKVNEFAWSDEIGEYDLILITDISVSEQVAGGLNALCDNSLIDIKLLDHHETATWLNDYSWAEVFFKHSSDGRETCGTSMLLDFLYDSNIITNDQFLTWLNFVELVRMYDTWGWAKTNDITPKQLNDLFWTYGRDRFIGKVLEAVEEDGFFSFDSADNLILEVKEEEIQRYIEKSQKQLTIMNVGRYNIGVIFGEQHISEVCHALHKLNPELDLIAMVNMNSRKISYRTDRENVDVGKFAKYFGGGGRKQTAGSEIDDNTLNMILGDIFLN